MKSLTNKSGFSLIEIMVATVVLLVIVLMVSMVFQQTSGAYLSGQNLINSQVELRNVMGMISRDLSLAVNPKDYGLENKVSFGASSISFLAMSGRGGSNSVELIEYSVNSGNVNRKISPVAGKIINGTNAWSVVSGSESFKVNSRPIDSLKFSTEGGDKINPARVDIEAKIETDSVSSFVSLHSLGPDGKKDTKDDIYVGGK